MSGIMFKMLNFRSWKKRHKYTELEMNEHNLTQSRSSFDDSLRRIQASNSPEWPNFPVEEELKNYDDQQSTTSLTPRPKSRFYPTRLSVPHSSGFFKRLKSMWTLFPIRDISWLVGFSFTLGSVAFVVNGFFLLLPLIDPDINFATETPYATPASSVLGAFIFLIGGYAGYLEGLNFREKAVILTNGLDVEDIETPEIRIKADEETCPQESEPKSDSDSVQSDGTVQISLRTSPSANRTDDQAKELQEASFAPLLGNSAFIYFPTMHQLCTRYAHSLCFHAGWVQFLGTIVFSVATTTSLPGVLTSSPSLVPLLNLLPATLGGLLFIIASVLQILHAQDIWWIPQPVRGKWQVGFWNAIGSLGFTLAGALPVLGTETATYIGILADFWGSWAFLIGSVIQLYIVMGYYA